MKKKILFLVAAVAVAAWLILAHFFEKKVTEEYLPNLQAYKERGIIDFAPENFKIEKYKFTVVVNDLALLANTPIKFDQLSACYNPFMDRVKLYNTGRAIFLGNDVQVLDPVVSFKVSRSALMGDMDNFSAMVSSGDLEFVKISDGTGVLSLEPIELKLSMKMDEKTQRYDWNFDLDTKDSSVNHVQHFKNFVATLAPEDQKRMNNPDLIEFLDYSDNLSRIIGTVGYKLEYSSSFHAQHRDVIKKFFEDHDTEEVLSVFTKIPFNINTKIDFMYGNGVAKGELGLKLNSNGEEIQADSIFAAKSNYPEDKMSQLIELEAKYLALDLNRIIANSDVKSLTPEDLKPLAEALMHIHDMNFEGSFSYNKENSNFEAHLNNKINNYEIDLTAEGTHKSLNGALKLSDPAKLIHAKAEFLRSVIFPLLEKTATIDAKKSLVLNKMNISTEENGFNALKALSKNPDLKEGQDFETDFSFDAERFEFKINDKTFLHIITDDRIVKFLKGIDEAQEAVEVKKSIIPGIGEQAL